jgi:hypothetical protein
MAKDKFASYPPAPGLPATTVIEIVPNDTEDLPQIVSALNVATPGTVRVTTTDGTTATVFISAGAVFLFRTVRFWATDTTATGIRGLI